MTDKSVAMALRSAARLVVVEAPAGCGKTHQAAEYARWWANSIGAGHMLILTHTHAACDVFRARTGSVRHRIHITTIDGFIAHVAGAYHVALGLPADVTAWAREQGNDGFDQLAARVNKLLGASKTVAQAIAFRYPVILCDEHQDASAAQHQAVMQLSRVGAQLRVFADPMQAIYVKASERNAHEQRWIDLCRLADVVDSLDLPHRWKTGSTELGNWTLEARHALKLGKSIDVRGEKPKGLHILHAENISPSRSLVRLGPGEGSAVRRIVSNAPSIMILASHNDTVRGITAFLGRSLPIWEGHVRQALPHLVDACKIANGDARVIAHAFIVFVQALSVGFSDTNFGGRLVAEVLSGAEKKCTGKPAHIQQLAKLLLERPDHVGVGRALTLLMHNIKENVSGFEEVRINYPREYWEAIRIGQYEDPLMGLTEITRRRTLIRTPMPTKLISTIHKAKGLEFDNVLILPCDAAHFGKADEKRHLLYVALSRATTSLTLVVSPSKPSPWLVSS